MIVLIRRSTVEDCTYIKILWECTQKLLLFHMILSQTENYHFITQLSLMVLLRSRAFVAVLFISKQEEDAWLPLIRADLESYPERFKQLLISGAEICPTTGRRHVHVYCGFEYQKAMTQLDRLLRLSGLPKPFIQAANKNDYSRIRADYLKLETKEDPDIICQLEWPYGLSLQDDTDTDFDRPSKKLKLTDQELRSMVESGDIQGIKDRDYRFYLRNKNSIEAEAARHRPKTLDEQKEHLWIVGETGCGKTSLAMNLWPDAYMWDLCNPNPEEYNNESNVIMDDMDNKRLRLLTVGKLKNLCNPAGTRCKVNYGAVYMKARIIVTSQYTLKECFKHKGKQKFVPNPDWQVPEDPIEEDPDYQALERRFKEVHIEDLLREHGLRLMTKEQRSKLSPEERGTYQFFEKYDYSTEYSECNFNPNGRYGSTVCDDTTECSSVSNGSSKKRTSAEAFVSTFNKPSKKVIVTPDKPIHVLENKKGKTLSELASELE